MKFQATIVLLVILVTAVLASGPAAANTAGSDVLNWKFKTAAKVYASPILRDGVIYIGSLDKNFYAIDAATGAEKWHFTASNQIFSTAAIYENIICFESGNVLYGLDLSGNPLWQYTMFSGSFANQHDDWDYFHSSPQLVDSIAYVGSEKGLVYGINVKTGEVVFQCQTKIAYATVETTPAVFDNKIYFGDWDGVLYVFDLTTCAQVWQYDTKKDNTYGWVNAIQTDPVILNGNVFFAGRSCNLYSLDAQTGARNWMFHDGGSMWLLGGPTIRDEVLYIGSSNQHFLQAFNISTGKKLWTAGVDYRVFGKPQVDGDYVFFGTGNEVNEPLGSIWALDKQSGEPKNRLAVDGQVHSSILIDNGVMYFGCGSGYVYALDEQKMINNPLPETQFKNKDKVNLGDVPQSTTSVETTIYVYNRGNGADSVTVSLTGNAAVIAACSIDISAFTLAPQDSQAVTVRINPSLLAVKSYSFSLSAASQNNLTQKTMAKSIRLNVVTATGMETGEPETPYSFCLEQNYPNPFNPGTTIRYAIPDAAAISLSVFDVLGKRIKTLVAAKTAAGEYEAYWDGADDQRIEVASGVYYYRLTMQAAGGQQTKTGKMLLMR